MNNKVHFATARKNGMVTQSLSWEVCDMTGTLKEHCQSMKGLKDRNSFFNQILWGLAARKPL